METWRKISNSTQPVAPVAWHPWRLPPAPPPLPPLAPRCAAAHAAAADRSTAADTSRHPVAGPEPRGWEGHWPRPPWEILPIFSMYGIFTYKPGWFLGQMLVNIPHMEHMGWEHQFFWRKMWSRSSKDVFYEVEFLWIFHHGKILGNTKFREENVE